MKRFLCLLTAALLMVALLPPAVMAAGPEVAAKSAVLMDLTTGTVLAEQNAHEKLAPASVTKVMTMLLIMEAIDSGKIHWDDTVIALIVRQNFSVARTEQYIDTLLADQKETKPKVDLSSFLSRLDQSLQRIRLSGVSAVSERRETDRQIVLTITIPK